MIFSCAELAVPPNIMQHVVRIESSGNPYAIGVVGGRLQRQPRNLSEAVSTAKMLEQKGYNFSLGLAQVNRYNLKKYGLHSYEQAFQVCPNLKAGSYILKECYDRSKDWGKSFSCYYSGNFVTGYRHGYVQKIFASMGYNFSSSNSKSVTPSTHKTKRKSTSNINNASNFNIAYNNKIKSNNSKSRNSFVESIQQEKVVTAKKASTKKEIVNKTTNTHIDSAFVF